MDKKSAKIKDSISQISDTTAKIADPENIISGAAIVKKDAVSVWSLFIKKIHRTVDIILRYIPFIIAAMMLFYGIARWYNGIHNGHPFTEYWFIYISSTIMIACGILMAVFHKAPRTTLIGFFTIGIASNRLLQGLYMFFHKYAFGDSQVIQTVVSIVMLAISGLFIAMATNMLISSSYYFRGISRKRRGMLISAILFMIFELIQVIIMIRAYGMTFGEIFRSDPSVFSRMALYIVYIILLSTEAIREKELLEHQSRALDGIRTTYLCDPFARMDRPMAIKVANIKNDWSLWKDKRGWGPVEYEFRFVIKNRSDHTFVTVQKWKDSDRLYFTAAKNHHGSLLDANRFPVDEILLDGPPEECSNIRFFNNEGLYIQIPVVDKKENDLDDGYLQ